MRRVGYIIILAALYCIALTIFSGRQWYSDTLSYIAAWDNSISHLTIDKWRPPVYPLFIGALKFCFGQYFLTAGVVVQHIVFLVSIWYFHKLTALVTSSEKIAFWVTAFYALYPCVATWNCFVVTEPFTIYATIFLLYFAYQVKCRQRVGDVLLFTFWLLFIIFLRPASMYMLPVFIVAWGMLFVSSSRQKRQSLWAAAGVLAVSACLLLYMYAFKQQYGIFSPSGIGVINKYYIARLDGDIDPSKTDHQALRTFVEESIATHGVKYSGGTDHDLYMETEEAIRIAGLTEVSQLVSRSQSIGTNIRRFFSRIHYAAGNRLFCTLLHKWRNLTDLFGLQLNTVYLLLIIYPLVVIPWMISRRRLAWFSSVLYMLGWSHLFVILFACQNVWDRLILPAIPFYLLMFGQLMNSLKACVNREVKYL